MRVRTLHARLRFELAPQLRRCLDQPRVGDQLAQKSFRAQVSRSTGGGEGWWSIMINIDRPIGYWLKKVDGLIDGHFERWLGDAGLTRRQWQVLNLLEDGPRSIPELQAELEPFLRDSPGELSDAVSGLVSRGWADSQNNVIGMAETGQAQFGLVKAKVAELRRASTLGVSPEDYQTAVDVLARMAANLESGGRSG